MASSAESVRTPITYASTAPKDDPRRSFHLKLRASQYEELKMKAAGARVSMSDYLVRFGLGKKVEQVSAGEIREVLAELRKLRRQIQGEATNVNQIAHWANSEQAFPAEAREVAAQLRSQVNAINLLRIRLVELL
ncbi:MobC family plasmid mobilization relaxosome protein [Actinotignum sp. GS-2025e]|uniref:MobC family plasmid mobilization relaxosome protein n=1 Tax=Actinotignum TaxID=1653174 RepID=UPI00254BFFEF|nr:MULTISPECIES: MobC family plasmid mobilization relaxosome protein [Actinotignum]MDK7272068.1 MobC family plasmid mobilization relaxosome protein [Actinotignum schaalii]MDK8657868.1 MobC family plasmid mobilization relaxosome protein [Actinotignum sanguinis]